MSTNEGELACRDFVTRCIRALDERDYDTLANGFADDGVWERGSEQLVGPATVRAALEKRPSNLTTQHLISNMVVDQTSDAAATVRYTLSAYAQVGEAEYHLHGIFKATDELKGSGDAWRFTRRRVEQAFAPTTSR